MPAIPESTRSSILLRLLDHAERNWPRLANVQARYRGSFAYITGVLPGGEQIPLFRLRYGGSAHSFGFAIYSPVRDRYDDAVLLTGLPIGSPQEALDTACTVHLAGLGHGPEQLPPTNLRCHPLRRPVRLLQYPDRASLLRPGGLRHAAAIPPQGPAPVTGVFPAGDFSTPSGDWDSGNPAFAISRGSSRRAAPYAWARPPVSWHAIVPFTFRILGQPSDPEISPPISARCAGDIALRLVAQQQQSAATRSASNDLSRPARASELR
jgi:hypothetical protein